MRVFSRERSERKEKSTSPNLTSVNSVARRPLCSRNPQSNKSSHTDSCNVECFFFPPLENKVHGNKKPDDSTQENTRGTITNGEKDTRKKKRIRNRFTQRQINYLEDVFSRQMYLTRDERALLAEILYMTELQIRNWFQNKRYQFRNKTINRPSFLRRQ